MDHECGSQESNQEKVEKQVIKIDAMEVLSLFKTVFGELYCWNLEAIPDGIKNI
jgi:hypothetical protein